MLRVCIASIQNVERSLLLLVVSASDIPLRTIKFFSVLFSGVFVHAACRHKQTFAGASPTVRSRQNCFCHFVVRTSSNRSIASAWPTVPYTQLRRRYMFLAFRTSSNLRQPAIRPESRFVPIPPCIRRPRQGGSRRNIATPFGMEKLEWCGYPMVKKCRRYVYSF